MELPITLDQASRQSLQAQLFDQLRSLVLGGRLKPGTPLPATRALSEQLGVSRNTVLLAYERLIAEGYLQTRTAVGTFVSFELPEDSLTLKAAGRAGEAAPERPPARQPVAFRGRAQAVVNRQWLAYDFWLGRPDPHSFPIKTWRRLLNRALVTAGTRFTEYRDPAGMLELRQAIANHLGPARGIKVDPEQIVIVAGCQEALNVTARLLLREGARAAIENPSYQGAAYLLHSYRAKLVPVAVDENGLCVEALPRKGAAIVYVTPSHQYPLGFTLSLERRLRLLDWAQRTGAYIIEDDYDSDFRYRGSPLAALMGLDSHGCVIYLGTFSKSMGAGLRLGYLVVPRHLAEPARTVKALLDNGHPWLDQAAMAEFIANGAYNNHLRRIRHLYGARRDCLVECLRKHFGDVPLSGTESGMHIAWHLPDSFPSALELQEMAAVRSVGIYSLQSGAAFDFGGCAYSERAVVLGYSSLDEQQIRAGIERVAAALDEWHARSRSARRAPVDRPIPARRTQ